MPRKGKGALRALPELEVRGSLTRAIAIRLAINLSLFFLITIAVVLMTVIAHDGYELGPSGMIFAQLALLAAAGCLAGCTIIMVGLMRQMIVAPLSRFTRAIEMIRSGAKDVPLPLDRSDEIGRLAAVFRSVMDSIEERDRMLLEQNYSLEMKIQSATADLRIALQESQRSQSILFGQHMILSRIATNAPLEESFDLIVSVFQGIVPQSLCAVLLIDDKKRHLNLASSAHLASEFIQAIDGLPVGEEGGVCGIAAQTSAFQSSSDLAADLADDRLKLAALGCGIVATWAQPILSRSGELLGTFNVFYTVAKEPDDEEVKFADMLADLAGIAIERARTERDLIMARDEAQFAARAKTDFLANMSHEIRTPMNGIMGLADLALDLALDAEPRGYLEMIRESSLSLMRIINDVLDFSKAEANRVELETAEIDLHHFIERTLSILSIRARQKALVFVSKIEPQVPRFVRGDVTRIGQIFNNLVTNAIKFTNKDGAVIIYIDSKSEANGLVDLRCAITDTGIGIPSEKQGMIFDIFTQADSSMTRRFGGTGLGLAICRQLTRLMGGDIAVRSNVNIGTAFHFNLLLEQANSLREEEAQSPIANGAVRTPKVEIFQADESPEQKRVLVADDNPVNLMLATRILENAGIEIVGVCDGAAVLEEIQKSRFDLILMDLQMPKLDGYETTRAIREAESTTAVRIPIVALTASDSSQDLQRCLDIGMDDYLQKPFRQFELTQKVDKFIY